MPVLPEGLFDLSDFIPEPIADLIKSAVDQVLGDDDNPTTVPVPVESRSDVVQVLDATIGMLEFLLKFSAIIPDAYEAPIKALVKAIGVVRGLID